MPIGRDYYEPQDITSLQSGSNPARLAGTSSTAAPIPFVNVKDYGAVGDGVTNDASAVQNAINVLPNSVGCLVFPPGTYLLTGGVSISGKNQVTVVGISGASILKAGASDTIFTVTNCGLFRMSSLQFLNSATGIYINGAIDSHFSDLYFSGQTTFGMRINGDSAMEVHVTDCVAREVPGIGFKYERTTATDSGGLYMTRCRALYSTVGTHGYTFSSSVANSTAFIFLTNCVADGYPDDACQFVNISSVNVTSSFFSCKSTTPSAKAALHITGGFDINLLGNYTFQGSTTNTAWAVLLDGGTHEVSVASHVFDGSGTNTALGITAAGASIRMGTYQNYLATFSDVPAKIATGSGPQQQGPFTILTRGSGGATDLLAIADADSMGSAFKYIRNSAGSLQILNGAFSAAIMNLNDNGDVTFTQGLFTGKVNLTSPTTGTTSPAAGGAGALPATPLGYVQIGINGTQRQIPYYA